MKSKRIWIMATFCFAALSVALWWQMSRMTLTETPPAPAKQHLIRDGNVAADARGVYTYPGVGRAMLPESLASKRPSLSMAVFFDAKLDCPMRLTEVGVIKKLMPVFAERGQVISALARKADSSAIRHFLDSTECALPLLVYDSADEEQLAQMGIGPQGTPFKIIYDSTFTAVYMRGADPTPESQEQFRVVAMRLSELAAKREL